MSKHAIQTRPATKPINVHNPEQTSLTERLKNVVENKDVLCDFGEKFSDAYFTDDQAPDKTFGRIFRQYINGSHEIRYIINDMFITLCGYEINTLLNQALEGVDVAETGDEQIAN